MKELESSNEIVEELRHTYPASGGPCLELTAADCIERLQREIEQYHATVDILQQTRMERDRLQRLIEDKDRIQDKQAAVISGLRAALERLRDACIESNDLVYAAIATEALGPAQETP